MKEQMNFPPSHESGTPFENEGQVDLHAGSPDLISLAELEAQRRRQAFQDAALGIANTPERRPLTPHEQLRRLQTRGIRLQHIESLNRGDFDKAA